MFENKKIKELEDKIEKIYEDQRSFIEYATRILQSVEKNDKARFMYEIKQEDVELIKDGEKYRAIRKIIL